MPTRWPNFSPLGLSSPECRTMRASSPMFEHTAWKSSSRCPRRPADRRSSKSPEGAGRGGQAGDFRLREPEHRRGPGAVPAREEDLPNGIFRCAVTDFPNGDFAVFFACETSFFVVDLKIRISLVPSSGCFRACRSGGNRAIVPFYGFVVPVIDDFEAARGRDGGRRPRHR